MKQNNSDQELLRAYAENRSEGAFAELVQRHVDVVYSAARRMIGEASLAEDVTQQVFVAVARNAARLAQHPVLCGWLHRTTQNLARNTLRTEVRRLAREKESVRMQAEEEPKKTWEEVAPLVDEAIAELSTPDRNIVLLRFFHGKSVRAIAETLSISDEAAQKRVSRALDRLRGRLAGRGVALGSEALAALIAAHGLQAAPAGLAMTICATAVQTVVQGALTTATTHALTMTMMQKTAVALSLVSVAGLSLVGAQRSSERQRDLNMTAQRADALITRVNEARQERDRFLDMVRMKTGDQQQLKDFSAELARLRNMLADLRTPRDMTQANVELLTNDPQFAMLKERVETLKTLASSMPERSIPEMQLMGNDDWIEVARESFKSEEPGWNAEERARAFFRDVRGRAKQKFGNQMMRAMFTYAQANDGSIPTSMDDLKPYFAGPVEEEILARYQVVGSGKLSEQSPGRITIAEKDLVDTAFDTKLVLEGKDAIRLMDLVEVDARRTMNPRP